MWPKYKRLHKQPDPKAVGNAVALMFANFHPHSRAGYSPISPSALT